MSPCPSRPTPSLVVRTPRHASRRLRPALAAEVRRIAKRRNVNVVDLDLKHVVNDPTHSLGIASDNASEWNSLLITARAERGPQWDVATQRFMVDYGSHLYFDPTALVVPEEPTPPPDGVDPSVPSPDDPSTASWPGDPRFAQPSGSGGMRNVNVNVNLATSARASLRLQQQQQQQQQQHQLPNGHNGIMMGNPYPFSMPNGRTPEQHHFAQMQAQAPHPYYDGIPTPSQHQTPSHNHGLGHNPHAQHVMTNGIAMGGGMGGGMGGSMGSSMGGSMGGAMGSPMMGRQMSAIGMGMEYGGAGMGGMPETPNQDMRRRTRSQQDGGMEMW